MLDALAESDCAAGRTAILLDGQYFRLQESADSLGLRRVPHREFLSSLAACGHSLLELMWEPTVFQHGRMAVIRTPYDFHRGGVFSHCGVDVCNLIRTNSGRKIAGIMDTVEPTGCAQSPLGPVGGRARSQSRPRVPRSDQRERSSSAGGRRGLDGGVRDSHFEADDFAEFGTRVAGPMPSSAVFHFKVFRKENMNR